MLSKGFGQLLMRLHSFQYDSYGGSFHVVALSEDQALQYLKNHLLAKAQKECPERLEKRYDGTTYTSYYWEEYEQWEKATLDNLPFRYTLVVREVGEVLVTECS